MSSAPTGRGPGDPGPSPDSDGPDLRAFRPDVGSGPVCLGVAVAAGLWWLYFDVVSLLVEHRLAETRGRSA